MQSGKYTLVYFSTEWCPFCQALDRGLEKALAGREDVAVRKIDILDWKSAAALQAAKEFGVEAVPYVRVHGPDGKFVGHVNGFDVDSLETLLKKPAK
ncbi:MAG: thioredoxin family protein [Planctomycetota bacterium]